MEYLEMLKRARNNIPEKRSGSRFEIPKAVTYASGKVTFIKNFAEISRSVRRNSGEIAKFLFKELGVPGEMKGNELALNGKIGDRMINQRIEEYVSQFVMCRECGRPDTDIMKEGKFSFIKCQACGARRSFRP